jgi:arsenate reductase (thioredoxin)
MKSESQTGAQPAAAHQPPQIFGDRFDRALIRLASNFRMETPAHRFKILFLCTWNASRSIFAEYFMKDIGSDRFEALSAGVTPRGQVSPITLKVLQDKFRIDASGARSKSWEEFKDEHLDFVVSVSEQAEQTSHAFPDQPILAHWPYDDPTKVQGTAEQVEAAYFRVASRIRYRLQLFNNLSFDQLDRLRIEVKMKNLAESN